MSIIIIKVVIDIRLSYLTPLFSEDNQACIVQHLGLTE